MLPFTIVILANAALLALAALFGGSWAFTALLFISLFTAAMDRFVAFATPAQASGEEFPTGARFSVILGFVHFALLALAVWGLVHGEMTLLQRAALFVAFALFFGQVSHPNAHELIHRRERLARRLGRSVYASLLYGQHASTHVLVHHLHVGTKADPATARQNEGFYRYFLRVWPAAFFVGLLAENARRRRASTPRHALSHPYVADFAIATFTLVFSVGLGGLAGLLILLGLALYAQLQIALADYVQHYGLARAFRENGKPEPVGPQHSWNMPHWYSAALMLNAPRHSDHHVNPQRPYPALRLDETVMPTLPHSLPVMAVIALFPPLYKRVMRRELARLHEARSPD